jgi:hypothetical protein
MIYLGALKIAARIHTLGPVQNESCAVWVQQAVLHCSGLKRSTRSERVTANSSACIECVGLVEGFAAGMFASPLLPSRGEQAGGLYTGLRSRLHTHAAQT